MVDESGNVINQYDYDAFGLINWNNSYEGIENRYKFQGREYDSHAGHYYYRYRTYIPEHGSFTGPDMNLSRGIMGEPNGVGNYLFCNNNPVDFRDPRGLHYYQEKYPGFLGDTMPNGWSNYMVSENWREELYAAPYNALSLVGNACGKLLDVFDLPDQACIEVTGSSLDEIELICSQNGVLWDDFVVLPFLALSKLDDIARVGNRLDDIIDVGKTARTVDNLDDIHDVAKGSKKVIKIVDKSNNGVYPIRTKRGVRWKDAETGLFVKPPNKGITILGHGTYQGSKSYVQVAQENNANFFRMSNRTYNKWLSEGGRAKVWDSNLLYLEEAYKRGDEFGLGTELKAPGFFADELKWLKHKEVDIDSIKRYY